MALVPLIDSKYLATFQQAAEFLKSETGSFPETAFVTGTGLSSSFNIPGASQSIDFKDIPGMPVPQCPGHGQKLLVFESAGKKVAVFSGKVHLYEGISLYEVLAQVFVAGLSGCRRMAFACAAGGLNPLYNPGDLMLHSGHLNFTGKRIQTIFKERYLLGMLKYSSDPLDREWLEQASSSLGHAGVPFRMGNFAQVTGPNYETPAEVRYYSRSGADAIGMSTVLEARAAGLIGMRTAACSIITNTPRDPGRPKLNHSYVENVAKSSAGLAGRFFDALLM